MREGSGVGSPRSRGRTQSSMASPPVVAVERSRERDCWRDGSPVQCPANVPLDEAGSMRMVHYFTGLAALVIPALAWTAWTGFAGGGEVHVGWGLFAAVYTAAVHTLLILFVLVTGRVLKEAMAARPLGPEFLAELNDFFARKKAYPFAILAACATAAAAVLGFAPRGFGMPVWIHWAAGLAAIAANLWAIPSEFRALRENQLLIDRAATELDRMDRESAANAEEGAAAEPWVYDPRNAARWG